MQPDSAKIIIRQNQRVIDTHEELSMLSRGTYLLGIIGIWDGLFVTTNTGVMMLCGKCSDKSQVGSDIWTYAYLEKEVQTITVREVSEIEFVIVGLS